MRNNYRLHPIRRYRIPGNFPLWESNGRNDPEVDSPAMMPTDQLIVEPTGQSKYQPVPLAGPVDDPQATIPDQTEAVSRPGDTKRPPDTGAIVATAAMEIPGNGLAELGSAMPTTPDNEDPSIPANGPDRVSQPDIAMLANPCTASIPPGDHASKIPFRQQVEDWLKREKLPYIRVDEAKRALFAGARLRSFHLVVYMAKTGPDWLLWTGPLNRECRKDMQQWESIFGDGFMAVIARPSRSLARGFSLQTLAGQTVPWPIQVAESQPNPQPKSPP